MASKNKTPLGLSQWEGTDTPERLDFNSDNLLTDWALMERVKKVENAKAGNFAVLTEDGGIVDSGKSVWDVGGSNENLLDNPNFRVNQKGKSVYSAPGYTVDRWKFNLVYETLTVTSNGVIIDSAGVAYGGLWQQSEPGAIPARAGEQYTFSVYFDEVSSGWYLDIHFVDAVTPASASTIGQILTSGVASTTLTIPQEYEFSEHSYFQFFICKATEEVVPAKLCWAKFERNSEQTLAHQNAKGKWALEEPPPHPALELMKCQRYYEPLVFHSGICVCDSDGKLTYGPMYQFKVTKRAFPAMVIGDATKCMVWNADTNTKITGCTLSPPTAYNGGMVCMSIEGKGLVKGNRYRVSINDFAVIADANL